MKNLKFGILACAVLGLVLAFVPDHGISMFTILKAAGMAYLVPVIGGFVLAAAMGGMAIQKPPLQKWQAGAAAAGFGAVFVRLEMWKLLERIGDAPMMGKLFIVAVLGGLIISIVAIVKGE